MKTLLLCVACLLVFASPLPAGDGATLSGTVVVKSKNDRIPGATIFVTGTRLGICANAEGYFQLKGIPAGEQEIQVSAAGFESVRKAFTFQDGESRVTTFDLAETSYEIGQVTVTATREKSLVTEVPAAVDVISSRDIELRNIQNIGQALEKISGVTMKNYGGSGDIKTVSIRGSTGSQVLVLIDGQRINSAETGDVDFSAVPMEGIERIEVVRGGASALYGADAVGGVVNIITKSKAGNENIGAKAKLLGGSFGTYGLEASADYSGKSLFSFLSYKRLKSDGDFPFFPSPGVEVKRQNGDFASREFFGKGEYTSGELGMEKTLTLTGQLFTSDAGAAGMITQPSPAARRKDRSQSLNLVYQQKVATPYNSIRVQSYLRNAEFFYDDPLAYVPVHSYNHSTSLGAEVQGRMVLSDWNVLTAGYAFRNDGVTSLQLGPRKTRKTNSLYLQEELDGSSISPSLARRIVAIPALRWDSFSDFGSRISPKIGAAVSTGEPWQVSLKSNFGASFRAPSFDDLYWPRDAFAIGNADLKPETGQDFDAGFMVRIPFLGGVSVNLTYFHNSITDMILWQPGGIGGLWSPKNIGRASLRGIEAKISVSPRRNVLRFDWNYTYLDPRNRTDAPNVKDKVLPYRPQHVHNLSAELNVAGVSLVATASFTSKRYITESNTAFLPSYHTIDLLAAYVVPFTPLKPMVSLEVKNIEDADYKVMEGFPMPGREFRFTASFEYMRLLSPSGPPQADGQ